MMSIYIQLLFASLFWGSNVIVMKILLEHIPFLFLAFLRVFFSLVFLFIGMLYKKTSFHQEHKFYVLILGFLSIYFNFLFTFIGMKEVKGVDTAFINALSPLLTLIFCFLFLSKKPTRKEIYAITLSIFAFLLSIRFQIFSLQKGFYYLLLGMSFYLLSQVFIQKWQFEKSEAFVFYQLLFGVFFLLIHCLYRQQIQFSSLVDVSLIQWFMFLIISGFGFAYIQSVYIKSINSIGALKTSFFLSLNPIFTYVESLIFLDEHFSILHFFSFVLLIGAIILVNSQKQKKTD